MRSRYFLTILAVLILVTICSVAINAVFLRQARFRLIDQQVRQAAAALIDSKLGSLREIDFQASEKIIAEELGESRISKFFVIRNEKGDEIFSSPLAKQLQSVIEIPKKPMWMQMNTKENYIRILNLQLPKLPDRTLTVGVLVDNDYVSFSYLAKPTLVFVFTITVIGFIASLFLTTYVLKPLVSLEEFLTKVSEQTRAQAQLDSVPEEILGTHSPKDEFQRMVSALKTLIDKVNANYRFSRLWAYQMAHELKTPLTISQLELERLLLLKKLSMDEVSPLVRENAKIADTISSFLGWAELESTHTRPHVFVNQVGETAKAVGERLSLSAGNRLDLSVVSDFSVTASPAHLEQLLSNLLVNALNYSTSRVSLAVNNHQLTISDHGPGIPLSVLERIGEPFNRGHGGRGQGLGLAWVKTICRLYGWDLKITPSAEGTRIAIDFPAMDSV